MTLSLYVLRHAKAETEAPAGGGDHERALRRRGRKAAAEVGRFLTRLDEVPERILSSTAVRARETAEVAREAGAWKAQIETRAALYEATTETLLKELGAGEDQARRLLLVGHQPALSLLIGELTGSEPDFPTAALARLDFELERWSEVRARSGRLVWLVTPETIGAIRPRTK